MASSQFSSLVVQSFVSCETPASDAKHHVRKQEFDAAISALTASSHAPVTVSATTSVALSLTGQALVAAVRLKTASLTGTEGLLQVGADGLTFVIGATANTAAAGNHAHGAATSSVPGFLSAADKAKLDGIAAGATAVALAGSGTSATAAHSDHTHEVVTPTTVGFMSIPDKIKLDGLSAFTGRSLAYVEPPASYLVSGVADTFSYDDSYFYLCVAGRWGVMPLSFIWTTPS